MKAKNLIETWNNLVSKYDKNEWHTSKFYLEIINNYFYIHTFGLLFKQQWQ